MNEENLTAATAASGSTPAHGGIRQRAGRPKAPKSDAVKRVRAKMGLTQENLARELGCTTAALVLMERETRLPSKPTVLAKFEALAKREGVPIVLDPEVAT